MKRIILALFLITVVSLAGNAVEADTTRIVHLDAVEVVSSPKEIGTMRQQPTLSSIIPGKQLSDNHITSLKGVSAIVPNFFMPDYGSRLTSAMYIRGVGSRMNTPAVGMYVDNIPQVDKSAFDFNFYDIERIDILRGPQGTLYGRNAMGGIIKVHTRNPFIYNGTDVNMSFATGDNHGRLSVNHYGKLNENFAVSVGGYAEMSNGFFKNDFTGKRADGVKAAGGRFRGIILPSDVLKVDYTVSYDYSDEGAYPYFYTGSLTDQESYPDYIGKITNNRESSYRRNMLNTGLNIEYHAEDFILNAVTGYQNLTDRMFLDQDFLAADIYTLEQKQRINTISEEVTMKSRKKGFWEWVNGVNIMYQALHTTGPVTFYEDGISMLERNINSVMPDLSAMKMSMAVGFNEEALVFGGTFDTPTFNAALFHQSTLHITDKLSATIGARLDYAHHQMAYNAPASIRFNFSMSSPMMPLNLKNLYANPAYEGTIKNDYLQVLPKVALKYDFSDNSNIYLSATKGMRSGGYNVQMFSDLLQGAMRNEMMSTIKTGVNTQLEQYKMMGMPERVIEMIAQNLELMPMGENPDVDQVVFRPEYSWNYEAGTHLSFPEARLQMDAAVFYVDTRDQQIARFTASGLGRQMVNAGKSESWGGEMSLTWRPLEALTMMANYGYTHATFKEYQVSETVDYSSNYVPFVPQHTVNIDAAYTFDIKGGNLVKKLTIGANYTGAGKIYWTESNNASQDFYSLVGARATLGGKWADLTLWAKNITGTKYNSFYFESASRGFEQHGKPFQVGIDLRVKF